ncbi:DMT family transporter [Bradyrhizobium sp. CIR3A]|uniref:DMT family transporter n=1 Tax=Bradyrhizobium sp. CIR3A TaxID=2663838 RepID=UPI0016066A5D|nr:DMT family transporter [Bradyrhizobium sp. CIR3A]MBB4261347.1 drug/metabolite transporter (DMT)-like permease [Bradyrhizobium sp. CIR3A]
MFKKTEHVGNTGNQGSLRGAALLAFVFLGITWGSNFIFMKWASEEITPSQIVLLRVAFALPPIAAYALWQRDLCWQHFRYAHHFLVMSLLATAIYYWAFAKGTSLLPSSIAGMLSGTIPLFTFVCSYIFLNEHRIRLANATGIGLGYFGVLLAMQPWSNSGQLDLAGGAYMMAGSFCLGCSFVYARKFISPLQLPAAALTTYQIGLAAVFLLLVTSLDGIDRVFGNTRSWAGLIFGLGLCGTGLAYIAYYFVIRQLGALAASSVAYIPPIVALLIGVIFAGDHVDLLGYLAMTLILAGVVILQFARKERS